MNVAATAVGTTAPASSEGVVAAGVYVDGRRQFVTQPPDPGGGDRTMDCLQGCAQAADRADDRKAACRTVPPVVVRVEKRHVRLPNVGAKARAG